MNVILRGSILYAAEAYYNLKENELRIIERIEEGFMRKLLKTTTGCPIVQLYLELAQIPARFQIMKLRLLFLKNILHEKPDSRIKMFLKLQLEGNKKGDWIKTCIEDLRSLNMSESLEEIEKFSKNQYRKEINKRIKESAFEYLKRKRKKKGIEINYSDFQMAEYLMPNNQNISIESQQYLFAVRNRMINIPTNFGGKSKCICGQNEENSHIYTCKIINEEKENVKFEKVFNGTLTEQVKILERFRNNMEIRAKNEKIREQMINENIKFPCDRISDPLTSVKVVSNGKI